MLKFNASTLCLASRHNFDCKNYYFTVSSLVHLLSIMVNPQQNHLTGYISLGALGAGGGGEGCTPLLSHISMCRPKGYGYCTFPV